MSYTPKTDLMAGYEDDKGFWVPHPDGSYVNVHFCRKMERENANLERELEKYKSLYFTMRELDAGAVEKVEKLERENAALRSDLNKCNNLSEIRRDAFYDEKSARWAMVDRARELERDNAALVKVLEGLAKGKDVPGVTVADLAEYAQRAVDAATDKEVAR